MPSPMAGGVTVIPAYLLARLALDVALHGQGLGPPSTDTTTSSLSATTRTVWPHAQHGPQGTRTLMAPSSLMPSCVVVRSPDPAGSPLVVSRASATSRHASGRAWSA